MIPVFRLLSRVIPTLLLGAWLACAPGVAAAAGAQDRLQVGLKQFRDGLYDFAARELRAFLKAAPDDPRRPQVLFIVAQAEIQEQNWPGARDALEELARSNGERGREALYWLGWVETKAGRKQQALRRFDAYLDHSGGEHRPDALYLSAELSREAGDWAATAIRLAAFLKEAPDDARRAAAWLGLTEALRSAGRAAEARDASRKALADPSIRSDPQAFEAAAMQGIESARELADPKAEAAFWSALADKAKTEPLRTRARFENGSARLAAGDVAGARTALESYLAIAPTGPQAARSHLLLADLKRKANDRRGALVHLEAALARPKDPVVAPKSLELRWAAFSLALALGDAERAAGHAEALERAGAPLTPDQKGSLQALLAQAALQADSPIKALGHWAAVPAEAAQYRSARLSAARTLMDLGRPKEALQRMTPLLAADDPDSEAHLLALAAAEADQDLRRAAELCSDLADRPPPGDSGADYLHRRVVHFRSLQDLNGYESALRELARRFPEDEHGVWAGTELQKRAFEAGDWERTVLWAKQAKRAGEDGAGGTAAYLEAEALWRLARTSEARQAFQSVASRPGPFRAQSLARLGAILDREGELDEAVQVYHQALDVGLAGVAAEWVKDRLASLRNRAAQAGESRAAQKGEYYPDTDEDGLDPEENIDR